MSWNSVDRLFVNTGNKKPQKDEEGGNSPEQKLLMGAVHNVDEFREEPGQTQTGEETLQREANNAQCAKSERTETEPIYEARDAPKPTDSDQNNKEDETKSASDNTEKLMVGQTEDNLQIGHEEVEQMEGACTIS